MTKREHAPRSFPSATPDVKSSKCGKNPNLWRRPAVSTPRYAALHYGADAIYLGLKQFSARADAANFTPDELDEITAYAHSLQPRRTVFATVNTLVLQDELSDLVRPARRARGHRRRRPDRPGPGRLPDRAAHFPELRLHASTQMAVHNRAGVETLKDLGFARVTLARELTLDEIREIIDAVPGVETEVFIHGALCYSYSGLCLFSSHVSAAAATAAAARTCAGTSSRHADGKEGFVFSMKDLALPEALRSAEQGRRDVLQDRRQDEEPAVCRRHDQLLPQADRRPRIHRRTQRVSRPTSKPFSAGHGQSSTPAPARPKT